MARHRWHHGPARETVAYHSIDAAPKTRVRASQNSCTPVTVSEDGAWMRMFRNATGLGG